MVPLDRAMTSFVLILNAKLLLTVIIHMRRITVSYDRLDSNRIQALTVALDIAASP